MRSFSISTTASLAALFFLSGANAQNETPTWAPMEIYGCNFVIGAGMDDLNGVIDTWNSWMDSKGRHDYTAIVLTPHFTAASFPYDVGWLGVWQNGAALGGMQEWLTDGASINDEFQDVVDCSSHQAMAITQLNAIGQVAEGDIVPAEFTDCTLKEGHTGPEAMTALTQLSKYMADKGSTAGNWILLPGPGEEPDATYSFKWITGYPSWAAVGHDFDVYMNGGGMQKAEELSQSIYSCNISRMYDTRLVRETATDNQ